MRMLAPPTPAVLMMMLATACAPNLGAGADADADSVVMVDEIGGPNIGHLDEGDNVFLTTIDASSETDWVYLSLVDGVQVEPDDPQTDPSWDLAFLRFHIKLNGGVSGASGVAAAQLDGVDFDDVSDAPAEGFEVDAPDGDDDDEDPDYVLRHWYDYSVMTHVLTPTATVYVVRSGDDHYRLQLDAYYDEAGSSGHPSFRWGSIAAP